jgi:exopolyphosphatase/guanosine-5'-triphosphate,3'-diphosphate pyrophosphatase
MIAIDLGSNTLRVTKLDCQSGKFIADFEKIVKTADMLRRTGVIHHEAVDRVIYAIQEAKKKIDFSSDMIKAVTTEALRSAINSQDVLARIKKETGVAFEVISGEEEARLTLLAVKYKLDRLHFASKAFVLADIGGGSTELIFSYPDKVISKSFPVGIVAIAQSYKSLTDIGSALPQEMLNIERFCMEIYAEQGKVDAFVATAGTPTTVAAMKMGQTYACYDSKKINGTTLQKEELDFYLNKLLNMPLAEREKTVGVGRSDLIAAGILIYKQLFNIVEFDTCVVIDDGLREGVALDHCHKKDGS